MLTSLYYDNVKKLINDKLNLASHADFPTFTLIYIYFLILINYKDLKLKL